MSERKADFDTPEKENKRPIMSGTPSAARSYRDEPSLGYDMMLSQRPCSATIALSLSVPELNQLCIDQVREAYQRLS